MPKASPSVKNCMKDRCFAPVANCMSGCLSNCTLFVLGYESIVSGSQISEPGTSENDPMKGSQSVQNISTVEFHQAQRLISLFFALCTKKPNLLQLVFNIYGRAPKAVKQPFVWTIEMLYDVYRDSSEETTSGTWNPTSSFLFILLFDLMQAIHRHIPIIIGALGPLYPELLSIISDPPEGSENLLTQVGRHNSIPMLSLLSRNEVFVTVEREREREEKNLILIHCNLYLQLRDIYIQG
ncbi:hypothetical protein CK203_050204 [Vitis vinifera]|uniref:Uncharacterized protein n=1 Tax=Vitis vinifera TaxID=29760 RepID=A0A438G0H0_VITVI|nr:hypothetical protein CK203_050204 [Vitis vinifera]